MSVETDRETTEDYIETVEPVFVDSSKHIRVIFHPSQYRLLRATGIEEQVQDYRVEAGDGSRATVTIAEFISIANENFKELDDEERIDSLAVVVLSPEARVQYADPILRDNPGAELHLHEGFLPSTGEFCLYPSVVIPKQEGEEHVT